MEDQLRLLSQHLLYTIDSHYRGKRALQLLGGVDPGMGYRKSFPRETTANTSTHTSDSKNNFSVVTESPRGILPFILFVKGHQHPTLSH